MGRRAKKAPVVTKKRTKLSKRFKCPFCANEDVVEAKMDHKTGVGSLTCRLCGASYQMPIHSLHEPIDVFSEWLDDCEAAAQQQQAPASTSAAAGGGGLLEEEDDDDDDALLATTGLKNKSSKSNTQKDNRHSRSIDLGDDDSEDDE